MTHDQSKQLVADIARAFESLEGFLGPSAPTPFKDAVSRIKFLNSKVQQEADPAGGNPRSGPGVI